MLIDTLTQTIANAMKKGDSLRVSTLKLLSAEIHNYHIDHPEMTKEEELTIVKKEAKKRKDAIAAYKKANLIERVHQEEAELKILQEFLPAEMPESELEKIILAVITETGAKNRQDMGKVIGRVMQKVQGNADGGKVAQLVQAKLP